MSLSFVMMVICFAMRALGTFALLALQAYKPESIHGKLDLNNPRQ